MGLLLSVLITCVGVLEVIACYTRFRVGITYNQCKSDVTDIARNYAWELRRNHLHHLFPDGEPEEEFSKRIEAHRSRSRASARVTTHATKSYAENEASDHEEDSTYDQISEIEDISKQIDNLEIDSNDAENEILELDAEDSEHTIPEHLEVTESKIQNEEIPKPDTNDSTFISESLEKAIQEMCSGKSETEIIENIILKDTTITENNFIEKEDVPKHSEIEAIPQQNLDTHEQPLITSNLTSNEELKIDTRITEDDPDKKLILETISTDQPKIDELLNQEPQILEIPKPSINEEFSNGTQKEETKGAEIINDIEDKPINYTQQLLDQEIEVLHIAENGRISSDPTEISDSKLEPKISEEQNESKDKQPTVKSYKDALLFKTEETSSLIAESAKTDDNVIPKELVSVLADLEAQIITEAPKEVVEEVCAKKETKTKTNKIVPANEPEMEKDKNINLETLIREIEMVVAPQEVQEEICTKKKIIHGMADASRTENKKEADIMESLLQEIEKNEAVNKEPVIEEVCIKQIKPEVSLGNTELETKEVKIDVTEIKKDVSETPNGEIKESCVEKELSKESDVVKTTNEVEKDIITDETEMKKVEMVEIKEPCITEEICTKTDVGNVEKVGTDNEMNSLINSKGELIERIIENRSLSPLPENKISDSTTQTVIPESLKAHPEFTTPEISTETGLLPEDITKSSSAADLECEEWLKNSVAAGLQADDSQVTQRVPSPYPMSLFGITTDNGISDLVVNEEFLRSLDGVKPSRCDDRRRSFKKKRNSSSSSRASRDRSATSVEDLDPKSDVDVGEKSLVAVEETKSNEDNPSQEENTVADVKQTVSVDKTKVRNVKEIRKKKFKKAAVSSFEEASSSQNDEVNRRELEKVNDNEKRPVSLPSTDAFWVNE